MSVASINVGFQVNVKELADKLNQAAAKLEEHKARFEEIGSAIGQAGMYIGRYVDQMAGTVISTIGGVVAFIPEIISGISKLNAILIANPWVALATVITAAGTALYFFTRKGSEAAQMQKMLNDVNAEALKNTAQERAELDSLLLVAQDGMAMKRDRLDAIKRLNEISPQYLGNIDLETINTKKATDAIGQYIDALNSKAREQAMVAKKTELFQKKIELETSKLGETGFLQDASNALFSFLGVQSDIVFSTKQEILDYAKSLNKTEEDTKRLLAVYEPYLKQREKDLAMYDRQITALDKYAKAERDKSGVIKNSSQNTISYYEEQIKSLQKLQKETAKSPDQYKAIQKQIDGYKAKIADIEGGSSVSSKKSKQLDAVKLDTIKFYESQIAELKKYQNEQALTVDEFNATAIKIEAVQQKIDAITGKRQKATAVTVDYSPSIEGSTVALEKQIKTLEKQREAIRVVFGEANIAYQALSNQIKDIEFEIKVKTNESALSTAKESIRNLQDSIEGQAKGSQQLLTQQREEAVIYAESVSGAFGQMSNSFLDSMGQAEDGLARFGQAMAATILKLIAMALSNAMANAIVGATQSANSTGPAAVFTTPVFIATAIAGILGAFASIPKFADGGVVYGPTLGLMGEYAGATRNPEVIAPLNKLKDLIEPANGGVTQILLGGKLIASGSDLQLVLDRHATRRKRVG
ncbi:hypothetical protein [Myroides sp. DF42-4-2]|uniref:hypothetical protein n=1 Tax=Myroides sp. DF42-4-2 TaxID=2746726 RepID=UPI0025791EA8|nr:hypothetical protein [Myroides sp. DF42-4-2]MDM1408052.1 hypothetical protein [Myroides sp. DF42-4-2]